jgi:hypothetical protein
MGDESGNDARTRGKHCDLGYGISSFYIFWTEVSIMFQSTFHTRGQYKDWSHTAMTIRGLNISYTAILNRYGDLFVNGIG